MFNHLREIINDDDLTPVLITPDEAWHRVSNYEKSFLVDIRSFYELLFTGYPEKSINIPWIDDPDWNVRDDFIPQVKKSLSSLSGISSVYNLDVILICRTGQRSADAGKRLISHGFNHVSHVEGGFEGKLDKNQHRSKVNGWRYYQLPWKQN